MAQKFYTVVTTEKHGDVLVLLEDYFDKKIIIAKMEGSDKRVYTKLVRGADDALYQEMCKDQKWIEEWSELVETQIAAIAENAKKLAKG